MRITKLIVGSLAILSLATSGLSAQSSTASAPVAHKTNAATSVPSMLGLPAGAGWIGLAGDVLFPVSDLGTNYDTGYGLTVPVGYDFANSPFGLRADFGYHRFDGQRAVSDAQIWSGKANVVMALPLINSLPRRASLYLIGGVGAYNLREYTQVANNGTSQYQGDSQTEWGLNGGGGLNLAMSPRASLYVESQFVTVRTDRPTNYVPVSLGFRLF